jgi:hypothetical protein
MPGSAVYPASLSQRLMQQAAARFATGATATTLRYSIRDLDAGALQRALTELRSRHESLRTRLVGSGQRMVQEVREPSPFPLEWVGDGSNPEAAESGNIPAGEAARARVWRGAGYVVLDIDHLFTDGWSNSLIKAEFQHLYAAYRLGREPDLPPVNWQYRHFAEWQLSRLSGAPLGRLQDAWLSRLAGAEAARLPEPGQRLPRRQRSSLVQFFQADQETARGLARLSSAGGTTPSSAAVTIYMLLLSMVSGQDDISIGSIFANRASPRSWQTVGMFAHMVPLRLALRPDLTLHDLLRNGRAMTAHALAHQELPMLLLPSGSLRRETALGIHNVVVNVLQFGGSSGASALPGGEDTVAQVLGHTRQGAIFDFELGLLPMSGRLDGFIKYATDRFTAEWVEEFSDGLLELIRLGAGDVGLCLGKLKSLCAPRLERMQAIATGWTPKAASSTPIIVR